MSNKNYKNYNSISSTKTTEEVKTEPVEVEVKEEVKPKPTPVVEQPKPLTGTVTGCAKLNVRKEPNKDADVITVIDEGSTVEISKAKSTMEFYAVCTAVGIEGYCMKKFIAPIK